MLVDEGGHQDIRAEHKEGIVLDDLLVETIAVGVHFTVEFAVLILGLGLSLAGFEQHGAHWWHTGVMIVGEGGVEIGQQLHAQLDGAADGIGGFLVAPWFGATGPGVEHRHGGEAGGVHAVDPLPAALGAADLRAPENAAQAGGGEAGDILVVPIGVRVDHKGVVRGSTIAGTDLGIGAPIVFLIEILVDHALQLHAVGLAHDLGGGSRGEGGVVRPEPEVITITLIDLVAGDTDVEVVGLVLVEQDLTCFAQGVVRHDAQPHSVRAGEWIHVLVDAGVLGDVGVDPEIEADAVLE